MSGFRAALADKARGVYIVSNSQVDRLGDGLRKERPTIDQIRQLDAFRQSFLEPYRHVIGRLTNLLRLQVTGRPSKSTGSIIEKLRRERVRLSQMQDIAGCRVIVEATPQQDQLVKKIELVLGVGTTFDRREQPSHGYRAVHMIAEIGGRTVEIQVRTRLQHLWAELSEKYADTYGSAIKYGGGDPGVRSQLDKLSELTASVEKHERTIAFYIEQVRGAGPGGKKARKLLRKWRTSQDSVRAEVQGLLRGIRSEVDGS